MTMLESGLGSQVLSSAESLNRGCFCRTLNVKRLRSHLESDPSLKGMMENIATTRPHLFASTVVFISNEMKQKIVATVAAIQRVVALTGYQAQALHRAPPIAQQAFGPVGACMGFDFHLGVAGPRLIEINTNAGGALLNVALARAQEQCCEAMDWTFVPNSELEGLEETLFEMFLKEWRTQRGNGHPGRLAIVDDEPANQYLAPEFELFRELFERHGVTSSIVDPLDLSWHDGKLWHADAPVDMVYNRLTDFYLDDPRHQALRHAYEAGAVVMTPDPRAHALYADKRNLIALSHDDMLAAWGASIDDRQLLKSVVPQTQLVTADRADEMWTQRRQLFFKPVAGHGAKAAYRGDKLTRRVWGEILAGQFVAQALVPPAERLIEVDGELTDLKFDIRAYTYGNRVQLLAARIYSGQTTNFRTHGGGFAPVIVVPMQ